MGEKSLIALVIVAVVVSGYSAYAIHTTDSDKQDTKITAPGADAAKLYNFMIKPKPYYVNLNLMPGKGELYPAKEPHGSLMTTYINDAALKSLNDKEGLADGSCLVAENYSVDKKLQTLTVMLKVKGYNPEAGDWFWVQYAVPDGYVLASGKMDACISCHSSSKASDYVYSGE